MTGEASAERSLAGATALVTGASRGIGRAISIALARRGVRLALTGRDSAALEKTADLADSASSSADRPAAKDGAASIVEDLISPGATERISDFVRDRFGTLDLLVCNAGTSLSKPLEETTEDEFDRLIAVNAKAPFFLSKHVLPLLRTSGHPVIVTVSSVVGRKGYAQQAAYAASKHALEGAMKALAREVQADGVRVHVIAPGGVATDMVHRMRPDIDESELIRPEEIARMVVFLASSAGNGVIDSIALRRATSTPWG